MQHDYLAVAFHPPLPTQSATFWKLKNKTKI